MCTNVQLSWKTILTEHPRLLDVGETKGFFIRMIIQFNYEKKYTQKNIIWIKIQQMIKHTV